MLKDGHESSGEREHRRKIKTSRGLKKGGRLRELDVFSLEMTF